MAAMNVERPKVDFCKALSSLQKVKFLASGINDLLSDFGHQKA
jgi:hypothetical protein